MFWQLTKKQKDSVQQLLKLVLLQVGLLPWAIVLFCAALLSFLETLAGLPGNAITARFLLDVFEPIVLLQFEMLVVVCAIYALWLLTNRDQIDVSVQYASTSIFPHISELLLFWLSLWSTLVATVLLFVRMTIPLKTQLARMVIPQTRFVAGLSPQLE